MKVTVSGRASVYSNESDEEVDDERVLSYLNGWVYREDTCDMYLDTTLAELGITGGMIRFAKVNDGRLRVFTDYWSPQRMSDWDLQRLVDDTLGQWTDGIGENGFDVTVDGKPFTVTLE